MPTTISQENAKQIRQPMEVHCTLMAGSGEKLSFSAINYKTGTASTLANTADSMRVLADLQQDGFALDGTASLLYGDAPAGTKLGVRSNIGTSTSVTVTCSTKVATLSIKVSGCDHITYQGTNYTATQGIVILPFNATSGTLTFYPSEVDGRAEVESILAGTVLDITDDILISCSLALRADLSTLDPSLPESEIEIVAYYPDDISDLISNVQDDVPITYYSGYPGDYSPERRFYLSEQVTWEDSALTIKGVDAVHKLDNETFPIFIGQNWRGEYTDNIAGVHRALYMAAEDQLRLGGVSLVERDPEPSYTASSPTKGNLQNSIIPRQSQRDVLANMMNLLHQDYSKGYFQGIDSFWLTYVDAGRPSLTWRKPGIKWTILEEDCADVKKEVTRRYNKIIFPTATVSATGFYYTQGESSAEAFKGSGVAPSYGDYISAAQFFGRAENASGANRNQIFYWTTASLGGPWAYDQGLPLFVLGSELDSDIASKTYGHWLFDSNIAENRKLYTTRGRESINWTGYTFPSWNETMSTGWSTLVEFGAIESDATSTSLESQEKRFQVSDSTYTVTASTPGITGEPQNTSWLGVMTAGRYGSTATMQILPKAGMDALIKRSNKTGSFTWKGNPHMQPRDVVDFVLRDGTHKTITIESIELKHEGGGLTASIAYREGQV